MWELSGYRVRNKLSEGDFLLRFNKDENILEKCKAADDEFDRTRIIDNFKGYYGA